MSNNNCTCGKNSCGIGETLQIINILQKNANCADSCLDSCDKPVLGCTSTCCICNTRPVMLYTCCQSSTPISMPISKDIMDCTVKENCSNVFRVEKVDECSATFRVLAPNKEDTGLYPYVATNSFFTMKLDCICILRCLNDTCVECL